MKNRNDLLLFGVGSALYLVAAWWLGFGHGSWGQIAKYIGPINLIAFGQELQAALDGRRLRKLIAEYHEAAGE